GAVGRADLAAREGQAGSRLPDPLWRLTSTRCGMSRVSLWLVGLVLIPSPGRAQQQAIIQVDGPGGIQVVQQAPPQAPTRDTSQTARTGTATLRGHVVASDTGQPLRKAQVRIMAPDLRENRLTSTDAEGKYEFKEVLPRP